MNLTVWVDVTIGMSLIYLGASLFVTIVNEYLVQLINLRGKHLIRQLGELIDDPTLRTWLQGSPAMAPLMLDEPAASAPATRAATAHVPPPSYVDTQVLAQVLIGRLASAAQGGDSAAAMAAVQTQLQRLPESTIKTQLLALVATANQDVDKLVKSVADWSERSLTAMGGLYKRHLQWISLALGLLVAITANIDSLTLCRYLYADKVSRDAMVALGTSLSDQTTRDTLHQCLTLPSSAAPRPDSCKALDDLTRSVLWQPDRLKLPLGWSSPMWLGADAGGATGCSAAAMLWKLAGWVITALAISLGAPFWFDLLNKVVNVRHGMRKPSPDTDTDRT